MDVENTIEMEIKYIYSLLRELKVECPPNCTKYDDIEDGIERILNVRYLVLGY